MAQYPSSAADDSNLYVAVNNKNTTLVGALTASGGNYSATEIEVADTAGFPSTGLITIDMEVISYTGVATSPHRFTGITRGQDGSAAVSHINGASIIHTNVAAHHNVLKEEVKAIENDLLTSRPRWFNYIANGAAANDTTGWVTYADAAGPSPVDGSGGSSTITWTRSTSSPLRGVASFVLTKDAANRQGEGVSYDFTIDSADKAKPLYIEFTYLPDTNYADDDISVWIYDITNAVLIQPAPYLLKNVLNTEKWSGVFQTAFNSTSYRLIIHIGSTNAAAYTVKFDDIRVNPQYAVMGSPVTDWVNFTPTGTWTTNTTYQGLWKRVGDTMEVQIRFAVTGVPDNVEPTFNLPPGYSIDTSKLANTGGFEAPVGEGYLFDSGTAYYPVKVSYLSATSVKIRYYDDTATGVTGNGIGGNTTPFTWASGDNGWVLFRVPIVGWSSSALMSDNADTRAVSMFLLNTTGQSFANNAWGTSSPSSVVFDSHGAYNIAASAYIVPVPGYYRVSAQAVFVNNTTGQRGVRVKKNGADTGIGDFGAADSGTGISTRRCVGILQCNSGDSITMQAYQNSGGSLAFYTGSTDVSPNFSVERISGPSQIAATETVACQYSTSAGNTISAPNVQTYIDYETKEVDSHGAVTGAGGGNTTTIGTGWRFNAPVSGLYRITATILYTNATYSANRFNSLKIIKNGATSAEFLTFREGSINQYWSNHISAMVRLLAGDYIQIANTTDNASTVTMHPSATNNRVFIERIGNYV